MTRYSILLADDDAVFASAIAGFLREHGHEVHAVARGDEALAAVRAHRPDVALLDVMMPGMSGDAVCRQLRAEIPRLPIIMLTGLGAEEDEVTGLESGADDYLVKPVRPRSLMARIDAVVRRVGVPIAGDDLRAGALVLSRSSRIVTLGGSRLALNDADFELLYLLAANAGAPVDRDTLYRELRGIAYDGLDRSIDVRVKRLRTRLGALGRDLIQTVRGVGYQLVITPG